MFTKEFQEIEDLGDQALQSLLQGKFRLAKQQLNKLYRSCFVTEASRARLGALLKFYSHQNDPAEALKVARANITYLWGSPELMAVLNFINPPMSKRSKLFEIEFTGACVSFYGYEDSVCSFEAIAQSPEEAMRYFLNIVPVVDIRSLRVFSVETYEVVPDEKIHEGMIQAFPFRRSSRIERRIKSKIRGEKLIPKDAAKDFSVPSPAFTAMMEAMMAEAPSKNSYGL